MKPREYYISIVIQLSGEDSDVRCRKIDISPHYFSINRLNYFIRNRKNYSIIFLVFSYVFNPSLPYSVANGATFFVADQVSLCFLEEKKREKNNRDL